ncbi:type II secretion system protein [Candidatus Omnitrophota bacterium]
MNPGKNRAFLLIELMITVIIVSVSIVMINHAFTSSIKATGITNDYLKAILFLEDKAFDIELPFGAVDEATSGDEEFMANSFHWETDFAAIDEGRESFSYDEEDLSLEKAISSVSWSRRNVERTVKIETYKQLLETQE